MDLFVHMPIGFAVMAWKRVPEFVVSVPGMVGDVLSKSCAQLSEAEDRLSEEVRKARMIGQVAVTFGGRQLRREVDARLRDVRQAAGGVVSFRPGDGAGGSNGAGAGRGRGRDRHGDAHQARIRPFGAAAAPSAPGAHRGLHQGDTGPYEADGSPQDGQGVPGEDDEPGPDEDGQSSGGGFGGRSAHPGVRRAVSVAGGLPADGSHARGTPGGAGLRGCQPRSSHRAPRHRPSARLVHRPGH